MTYPWALLALPVAVALGWALWRMRADYVAAQQWLWGGRTSRPLRLRAWGRFALRTVALLLLVVALVGPRLPGVPDPGLPLRREVWVLMDLSASMQVKDLPPNRLAFAKRKVRALLPQLAGAHLGLIAFTDYAFVQCPLTTDTAAFAQLLEVLGPDQLAHSGTQFRPALAMAWRGFARRDSLDPPRGQVQRQVLLLTDGLDYGPPSTSIELIFQEQGIGLTPVLVGTPGGGPLPQAIREANPAARAARTGVTETTARQLEERFGVEPLRLDAPTATLAQVPDRLASGPKAWPNWQAQPEAWANLYALPLSLALLCLLAAALWPAPNPPKPEA